MNPNNLQEDNSSYSIKEFFHLLNKHFSKIFFSIFVALLLTLIITLIVKPEYKSNSSIMITKDSSSAMSFLDLNLGSDLNYIANEIEIIKSRTTSELVVRSLLNSEYKNNLYLLSTRKYEPSLFRKIFTLGILDKMNGNIFNAEAINDSLINLFTENLMKEIRVINKRNTDSINISYSSYDPEEAALIVNTIIDVYVNRDLKWVTGEMSHLKEFVQEQLLLKEKELNSIEESLKKFQEEEKIFALDENSTILLNNLSDLEVTYNNTLAEISIINEKEKYINNQLTIDEKELAKKISSTINDRLYALKNEMNFLETDLISTISQYGESHSAVNEMKEKLSRLKKNIEDETKILISQGISVANPIQFRQNLMDSLISVKSVKSTLESKSFAFKEILDQYELKLKSLPEKVLEYTRLERKRTIHAQTFSFMSQKLEEAKIGEASKLGKIRVIDRAIIDDRPTNPKLFYNLIIGFFFGVLLSITLIFVIEVFDNTIRSIEQIERRNLSLLSIIPEIDLHEKKSKTNKYIQNNKSIKTLQRRLITHENPKSPVSEAYRTLRTSLMYTRNNNSSCKFILVSSPGPGEGKTTTIANLAITYANLGKKTLIIDSDLRKPVLHKVFKKDKTPGLTSFLSSQMNLSQIIKKSEIDNLDVITSGVTPPNPSELLESDRMLKFMEKVKKSYDVVLFDSPPLIAVTDAYVILKYIDQFILVLRAGVTEKGGLDRVMSAVKQSKLDITGVVFNALSANNSYGSGYYYNYYQYYYAEEQ